MSRLNLLKVLSLAVSLNIGLVASAGTQWSAQPVGPSRQCVIPRVGGERVPFPLRAANTKFELAENETYLLNGTLVMLEEKVYLKADFETQPWLATARMLRFPYFLVDSVDTSMVSRMSGRLVQVAVIAHRDTSSETDGQQALLLKFILPPVQFPQ